MAELVTHVLEQDKPYHPAVALTMHLYCWPCRAVHAFPLAEVERIVYALGADAADLNHEGPAEEIACLFDVQRWAESGPYAEHVEQGIECRERADG